MKTDRELLELAAKAAGHVINQRRQASRDAMCDPEKSSLWIDRVSTGWSPILDDGQALRLACDLGLRVYPIARTSSGAACSAVGDVTGERLSEVSDASLDTRSATRRAIVQAAAAIGEAMP